MDPAAAAKRWPQIDFDGIKKVYFEYEGGYLLARHACDAVVRELVRAGGSYRQVAVTSVQQQRGRPDVRLSDGTRLDADRYVFACGPWLGRLFPDVIGSRVRPTRQEVFYFGTAAGDDRFLAAVLDTEAQIALAGGKHDRAMALAARSHDLARESGNRLAEMAAQLTAARVQRARGDRVGAEERYAAAAAIAREGASQGRLRELLGEWADLRAEAGDYQGAYELSAEAVRIN